MATRCTRRTFVKSAATLGLALPLVPSRLLRAASPNGVLRHASFGANGMAWADISSLTRSKQLHLVAACDVDESRFDKLAKQFPDTRRYTDWRVMLEKEAAHIDSVNVTVPDHMHAPIALSALRAGKHVYCQKPLTKWITEARALRREAEHRPAQITQMGIQIHSNLEYRLGVHLIQSGAIGKVRRVHSFEAKSWGGPGQRPDRVDPTPAGFNWDHWLGVAPQRPFSSGAYHPSQWRRWCDFGTGTFGDMGCHILDPVFKSLELTAPTRVTSHGPAATAEQWPERAMVHYVFPGTAHTADSTIEVTWYDGGALPGVEVFALLGEMKPPRAGSIFIGDKGVMLLPHVAGPRLLPATQYADFKMPDLGPDNHWTQFVDACRGEGKTRCHWGYAGPLTEAVLLGTVALRFPGQTLQWDAAGMKVVNFPQANEWVGRKYREGWQVQGLG
jgi:predicted dehydrogenase